MLTTEIQNLPYWYCGIGIALHIIYQKTNIEVQSNIYIPPTPPYDIYKTNKKNIILDKG